MFLYLKFKSDNMGAIQEKVSSFKKEDWKFESDNDGKSGYVNEKESSWISSLEFHKRKKLCEAYEEKYKLIADFRSSCLPFGKYPEYVIQEFLETHFVEQLKKENND